MSDRPNILFITTDQQRWDTLSLYGQPGYKTPVLDRLAREGICFDNAYTPSPICTPARVSMLNGQYPTTHGAYVIGMEAVPALQGDTFGSLLSEAGYKTGLIGKTHFVARHLEEKHIAGNPFPTPEDSWPDEQFWVDFKGPYAGFEYVQHCQSHTCDRPPNGSYRAWLSKKGKNLDHLHNGRDEEMNVTKTIKMPGAWDIDPELTQKAWITEESIAFIERAREKGEPWCCWASYQDPHPPFVCPEPYFSDVDMEGVDLGGVKEGEFDDKPSFLRRFMNGKYWTDEPDINYWDGINVPAAGLQKEGMDVYNSIKAYIGMVNMLDVYIGRLLEHVENIGARENTLIIFTTDHGDYLGCHGIWNKGIPAYDDAQRIPAIISWPKQQKCETGRRDAYFNLVDVMPTFCDAAGVELPPFTQGKSQLPVIRGEVDTIQDWALIDFHCTVNLHQQTFIHDGYKLVVYRHTDQAELYDMKNDPNQYVNLIHKPESREIRERLMHRLVRANMEAIGVMPKRIWHA